MSDIVERLRAYGNRKEDNLAHCHAHDAADEIERLRNENHLLHHNLAGLEGIVAERCKRIRQEMRERCAKIADCYHEIGPEPFSKRIAERIRALPLE